MRLGQALGGGRALRLGYARGPRAAVKKCLGSSSAEEKNLDFAIFKEFVLSGVCLVRSLYFQRSSWR